MIKSQALIKAKTAKLAKKHFLLVEKLKKVLMLSQLGFLQAGHYLYEIKRLKSYTTEDSSEEVSFTDFLSRPDLPLPGHTPESRVRVAQALIRIWQIFKIQHSIDDQKLAEIGWTKLDLIAKVVKDEKEDIDEWVEKARTLSIRDLSKEISGGGKSLMELSKCDHKNHPEWIKEIHIWKCIKCGMIWNKDPRPAWKHQKKQH